MKLSHAIAAFMAATVLQPATASAAPTTYNIHPVVDFHFSKRPNGDAAFTLYKSVNYVDAKGSHTENLGQNTFVGAPLAGYYAVQSYGCQATQQARSAVTRILVASFGVAAGNAASIAIQIVPKQSFGAAFLENGYVGVYYGAPDAC